MKAFDVVGLLVGLEVVVASVGRGHTATAVAVVGVLVLHVYGLWQRREIVRLRAQTRRESSPGS